ncbi:MAG: hypothetical protein WAK20_05615 [Candidatus Acidiferrum sp.]
MRRLLVFLILILMLVSPLAAQQTPIALDPTLLPGRTIFYLAWHGAPSSDVRHANALMSLWDDPDLAELRNSFVQSGLSDQKEKTGKPTLTKEELNEYATLLDNPMIIGYLPRPASLAVESAASTSKAAAPPAWNGGFLIYDRTGKEAVLSKAVLRIRGSETELPKLTNLTVAGVQALKIERKNNVTYWTENGKYAVAASELPVFEEILNRLAGTVKGPSLAESAAYLEAKPLLSGGIVEVFLRISQISETASESASSNPQLKLLIKNLKLDSLHLLAGHLSFEGPRTRIQGSILGDTSPGTLFDIWAKGKTNPDAMTFVSANTVSFNSSEIDFLGIYKVLKQALLQASSDSPAMVTALESAAQTRLGMSLTEALSLTTGEISSVQNSPALDDGQQIRIIGIHNKPDVLKLLRTIEGDKITSERNDGTTTYMKVSLSGSQGSTGVAQWNFYHLAITPDFLLGASKSEAINALLAQSGENPDSRAPKHILNARSKFPEELNGFSYFDFQKVDWPAARERWVLQARKDAAKATDPKDKNSASASVNNRKFSDWLATIDPAVFPRHLHSMTGASWKDAKGVHFDEWIE